MNAHAPDLPERPILRYAVRRQRTHDLRPSERFKVVAAHCWPIINHHDYTTTHSAPMTKDAAKKLARGLNMLLGLPRGKAAEPFPMKPAKFSMTDEIDMHIKAVRLATKHISALGTVLGKIPIT